MLEHSKFQTYFLTIFGYVFQSIFKGSQNFRLKKYSYSFSNAFSSDLWPLCLCLHEHFRKVFENFRSFSQNASKLLESTRGTQWTILRWYLVLQQFWASTCCPVNLVNFHIPRYHESTFPSFRWHWLTVKGICWTTIEAGYLNRTGAIAFFSMKCESPYSILLMKNTNSGNGRWTGVINFHF